MSKSELSNRIRELLRSKTHEERCDILFDGDHSKYDEYSFFDPKNRWNIIEKLVQDDTYDKGGYIDEYEYVPQRLSKYELIDLYEKLLEN